MRVYWMYKDDSKICWMYKDDSSEICWMYKDDSKICWMYKDYSNEICWMYKVDSDEICWMYKDDSDESMPDVQGRYTPRWTFSRAYNVTTILPCVASSTTRWTSSCAHNGGHTCLVDTRLLKNNKKQNKLTKVLWYLTMENVQEVKFCMRV
ncbi:hypothetical protein PoB_006142400 [Plakobranchus ocellatus]|uniref:Uncharacterized protein n=1 Tax=Plakobranchus ocellatus TaxID=259542 RepID=A0AAV4CST9_9GAST|nr:hypothetical protein PoB_006142400 [Plakobranchus ocellatus]